ncbi:hypothetical protein [Streptomyces sp. NPDC059209]|uniref:hypothetical protein n=1 Tax=Streptomyces sp. NPDC059209 TaxID=3346769 RepID=UPI0036807424
MLVDLAGRGHTKIVDTSPELDPDRQGRLDGCPANGPPALPTSGNYQPLRGICAAEFLLIGA